MEIDSILKEIGARNGLEIALDENRACTLELSDGRAVLLQERAALNELDFVATLGPVPEEVRAAVFTELLAANFYWQETFGATLSWNAALEEVVLIFPLPPAAPPRPRGSPAPSAAGSAATRSWPATPPSARR